MDKLDAKKTLKHLYSAGGQCVALQVPVMRYLMVDGDGDPNENPSYAEAVRALFAVSYAIKFLVKRTGGRDYVVMPLEGLWWSLDLSCFRLNDRNQWQWTLMIMQPQPVSETHIERALALVGDKGVLGLDRLRVETWCEGWCAQTLHVGPFTAEGPTVDRLHAFIEARGSLRGKHHEIYLSDIRRAAPSRWKTIIRQAMTHS